ncbi:MAG: hypothetical protein LUI07_08005 [Lachnospiraceae bacterium]|nr:hypothetical protein [Lachnospiraceae bacterium]
MENQRIAADGWLLALYASHRVPETDQAACDRGVTVSGQQRGKRNDR